MRRIFSILFLLIPLYTFSQNPSYYVYDGLRFSQHYYDGTAKSLSMANAFTALGGDLGAISINPASSGVYRYSEILISPTINTSVDHTDYLNKHSFNSRTMFGISNFGYVGYFKTGNHFGLKNLNFSIAYNQTNNFNSHTSAEGINAVNSWAASLAHNIPAGTTGSNLGIPENNPNYPFYNSNNSWESILAWNSHLIDPINKDEKDFISSTENIDKDGNITLGGPLNQKFERITTGFNSDIILNVGGNISDKLFFGLNLTITNLYYYSFESFSEKTDNPANFDTKFNKFTYNSYYNASGIGFNAKVGIIYLPVAGLRLGAAISTPTWTAIKEDYSMDMETIFSTPDKGGYIESPLGVYEYKLTSPFIWNLGAAYTFGKLAVISVDYENTDYSMVKLKDSDFDSYSFNNENEYISRYFKMTHNIKVGAEFKPIPIISIRAGYNYYDSPEKDFNTDRHYASLGLGYRSNGGFFIDLGYQQQCNFNEETYTFYEAYNNSGEIPQMYNKFLNWKLVLSLGIRF